MSHAQEASGIADDDLAATQTPGYKPGEKRDLNELANLDADDEALRKWKASLGVTADGAGAAAGGKTTVSAVSYVIERGISATRAGSGTREGAAHRCCSATKASS